MVISPLSVSRRQLRLRTFFCVLVIPALVSACLSSSPAQSTGSSSYQGKGYILGPDEGEKVLSHLIKVDPETGSQRLALGRQRVGAGRGIALHIHDAEDEVLYVSRGRGIGVVGETTREVVPGSLIYVPQGAWHGIQSLEEMEILWIVSPPHFARHLRELQAAGGDAPASKRDEIARKHQQGDGRAFLRAVLAGSKWRGQDPWGRVIFDMTGLQASFEDSAGARGTLQLRDSSADGLGFVGIWRRNASETGDLTLRYDFKSGSEITLRWGEGAQRQSVLVRER
jgi:quercetin dioxygenase-like cupin family protein